MAEKKKRKISQRAQMLIDLYGKPGMDRRMRQAESGAMAKRNVMDKAIADMQKTAAAEFAKGSKASSKRNEKIAALKAKQEKNIRAKNQPPSRDQLEKDLARLTNAMARRSGFLSAPEGATPEIVDYYRRINQTRSEAAKAEFDKINALRARLGMKPIGYKPPPPPIDEATLVGPKQPDQYMKFAQNMGYVQPDSSFVAQMDSTYNANKPKQIQAGSKPAPKTTVASPKKSYRERLMERNAYKMVPRRQRN
tara:strand:+ start:192 stop:944 length:753 start_codon:yes stop_codon:yes gene_type:complete